MEMICRIRRMHRRDRKSVREIARATGLSRNTAAKWLGETAPQAPKSGRRAQPTKLEPFHDASCALGRRTRAVRSASGARRWHR